MKFLLCLITVGCTLLAGAFFMLTELVLKGLITAPASAGRYFGATVIFGLLAAGFLRALVERD